MQGIESRSVSEGQQDALGNFRCSLESGAEGWGGEASRRSRSQIKKGLVDSAKKGELALNTYREPLKACMHEADMVS